MKHPQAKLIKTGSSVRLPFDQLQSMHLSLRLTLAPRKGEGIANGIIVAIDPCGQTAQFGNLTGFGFLEPALKHFHLPLGHHGAEILDQLVDEAQFVVSYAQGVQLPPDLPPFQFARMADEEPGGSASGKWDARRPTGHALQLLLICLLPSRVPTQGAKVVAQQSYHFPESHVLVVLQSDESHSALPLSSAGADRACKDQACLYALLGQFRERPAS